MDKELIIILWVLLSVSVGPLIIYLITKNIVESSKWTTIKTLKSYKIIDNTKSLYYQYNGFHPYDAMNDETVLECVIKIQEHKETKKLRLIYGGDFSDDKLENDALEIVNSLKNN